MRDVGVKERREETFPNADDVTVVADRVAVLGRCELLGAPYAKEWYEG